MLQLGRGARRARAETGRDRTPGGATGSSASTVLGVVVLAVLGAVMGPQWDPVPLTDPLTVETSSTAIGDAGAGRPPTRSRRRS